MRSLVYRVFLGLVVGITVCSDQCFAINSETEKYLQTIADKCLANYFPIPNWERGIVSESFILDANGTVSQIAILVHPKEYGTNCTSKMADSILTSSIENAAPFQKPPALLHAPIKLVLIYDRSNLLKPLKARINIAH